jgi:mono/diheme cytochrome c family protein
MGARFPPRPSGRMRRRHPGHLALVEKQVRNGGGAMPPFAGVLSDRQIDLVAHYVAPKG